MDGGSPCQQFGDTDSLHLYRLCMDHGHINKHYRHTASGYVVTIRMQYNLPYNLSIKSISALEQEGGNMLAAIVTVRKDNYARVFTAAIPMLTSHHFSYKWIFS